MDRKRSVRPRSVCTKKAFHVVRERIRRSGPEAKDFIFEHEDSTYNHVVYLKDDLGLGAFKRRTSYFLTNHFKKSK